MRHTHTCSNCGSVEEIDILSLIEDIMTAISDLQAAVANDQTVEQSAITLIQGLAAQLNTISQELAASGADTTALETVVGQLNSNASALAQAVTANTVSAPVAGSPPAPTPAPINTSGT
jgi:hypothetical protein